MSAAENARISGVFGVKNGFRSRNELLRYEKLLFSAKKTDFAVKYGKKQDPITVSKKQTYITYERSLNYDDFSWAK